MNIEDLKSNLRTVMKSGNTLEKNLYKLIISEYELIKSRGVKPELTKIVKKLIESNNECIEVGGAYMPNEKQKLTLENEFLQAMLPQELSVVDFLNILNDKVELNAIKNASNDNQAMGIAMKFVKSNGLVIDSQTVKQAITMIKEANYA